MRTQTWPLSLRAYVGLTKPGIVMGNGITAAGGFFFAMKGTLDVARFLAMLVGLSFVIASGCVYNNYSDRQADAKMKRTQGRALVQGVLPLADVLRFALGLGVIGFWILAQHTNLLTAALAFFGFFNYVVLYGWSKYRTVYGTLIGSISGAIPPVVGYAAVKGQLDLASGLLFAILVLWQMPHFYAIAIYRLEEYRAASIPVLPAVVGIAKTKVHMIVYLMAFVSVSLLPTWLGYAGRTYGVGMGLLGLLWLGLCVRSLWSQAEGKSARELFLFSLVVITAFSALISIDGGNT